MEVVHEFLTLIANERLVGRARYKETLSNYSTTHPWLTKSMRLVLFLQKYGCDLALKTLMMVYDRLLSEERVWGWQAFCLGAVADCSQLCIASLNYQFEFMLGNRKRAASIPPQIWAQLSPKFTYALAVADVDRLGEPAERDDSAVVSRFRAALYRFQAT